MENINFDWKTSARNGLLGSVIMLYFSMIGMVEVFSARNLIGDLLNMGHLLLYGGAIAAALLTVRHTNREGGDVWLSALVTGVMTTLLPIALVQLNSVVNMRAVFLNVSPPLMDLITLGIGGPVGMALFALVTIAIVMITAAFTRLQEGLQKPLAIAIAYVLIIASFSELVIQVLVNLFGTRVSNLFFTSKALNIIPAVAILVIVFGSQYVRIRRYGPEKREKAVKAPPDKRTQYIQLGIVVAVMAIAPWILGTFLSQALFEVGRFILMGLGLNIVVGYAGLLDLGYVAFFAFGAYTMGVMTTGTDLNMGGGVVNFWMAIPIAVLISVLFGVLLGFPVLRMRGDYLAIVTLGFGEIIRILALSDWLSPIIGGAQGILKIPNPNFFGIQMNQPQHMYYLIVLGALLVGFISIRLRDSRLGRQWKAMREDEDVAEAMGINLVQTKLMAFAIGAGFSGLAGAIFAARLGTIFPHTFSLLVSINALALIIVGGLGSIPGVVVGAIVLVGLPELLREFTEYRLLLYGILLIVMMLLRPEGFIPAEVFKRELHAGEEQPEFTGVSAD